MPTRFIRNSILFSLLLICAIPVFAAEPLLIGDRRELFIDEALVDKLTGEAEIRLQHPISREVVFKFDQPWEGSSSGYHTIFKDGDLYRLYYRGSHIIVSEGRINTGSHKPFYCYAESNDGIHWTRPELGIVEFKGSKKNNIILEGRGTHNFAPFKDENPNCKPAAKYKALAGIQSEGGLYAFQSTDGIHWKLMQEKPVITKGAFDSQNLAFWDSDQKTYRAYYRIFTKGITTSKTWKPEGDRAIRTATSDDFLNWGNEADLTYEDSPSEQLYTNQIKAYHRAPHIRIGFPARYIERGWSESMKALPDLKRRELRASSVERYGTAISEGLLMASRDGVHFKRWNEAFLRPGLERSGTWQYGHQFIAEHVVETKSTLPGAPDELSIYAPEDYWHGKGGALRRYTLRLDGFTSVRSSMKGGELISKPIIFEGSKLSVNFATSAAGSLRIELQTPKGKPIQGFTLRECADLFGDSVDRIVTWNQNADVSSLQGKPIRLLIQLKDADLFSFQFQK
ncbi:hypothetical protein [Gimesia aquarii]|uniref:Glycosyl hydrolase family 32 N-terminal domain-containing protein n=1 Tax=Gimesia aquarii TaxID=2527964 RepID=A0A517VU86_9PLAN|nr:hypothetical protein [Gimesia aquarii]QDT96550.1 hypothetical protein V144x_20080 [Gimesia aquarii]